MKPKSDFHIAGQPMESHPEYSLEERVRNFVEQIKNPYCFKYGDVVVKTSFLDTDVTQEDCVESHLRNR